MTLEQQKQIEREFKAGLPMIEWRAE